MHRNVNSQGKGSGCAKFLFGACAVEECEGALAATAVKLCSEGSSAGDCGAIHDKVLNSNNMLDHFWLLLPDL